MKDSWKPSVLGKENQGIRKKVLVLYTVNCSSFAAHEICYHFRKKGKDVDVVGNESCYDNQMVINRLLRYATHVNVRAVLVVGHGCEFIQAEKIAAFARERGRNTSVIYGQRVGTEKVIRDGIAIIEEMFSRMDEVNPVNSVGDILGLTVQTERLQGTSVEQIAAFAALCVQQGKAVVYKPLVLTAKQAMELGISCPEYAKMLIDLSDKSIWLQKNDRGYACMTGNLAVTSLLMPLVRGVVKIAMRPTGPGVWLLDNYQDQDLYKGYPNATVLSDLLEYAACGAKLNVLACDRRIDTASPVAPTLCCSFGEREWDRDIQLDEKTDPGLILEEVKAAEAGKTLLCEKRVFQEHMIFRNSQNQCR